ncbi:ABC transporter ATP-binding protein [Mycoplasma flocculare]|uniref:ATP-binding protein n=3 Tax=Mesomycoplasma flocculare TaxID=2128 RepID=A0A0A8E7W5_MESFC|nr:AAA domain-containing protein [Mesomycoplasma flocculare]MXR39575.1 ABC transporter ATP-binding protein [Mycoplasma sp. MF12]AJC50063.1 ATP-binding protein [Mesomycoplasma flocculare ATCC 27399]MXR05943.1 ABC transporter ATP-binding protein [Mesomycoplasma flocculare]MXR12411.1 ABC transporter ATP-binding protein [Mesomycoplasma flocculare]MXR13566.1 ABC transporter ATP-binding protein [Mesomycoplasma flocculare]
MQKFGSQTHENQNSNNTNQNLSYERLLANLITVERTDSALFTKIDGENYIDLFISLKSSDFKKLITSPISSVSLAASEFDDLVEKIEAINNKEELVEFLKNSDYKVNPLSLRSLNSDFEAGKKDILNKISYKKQTSLAKWKRLIKKAYDILRDRNIWPLHIGFFYISLTIEDRSFFGPLFVKECEVTIVNSVPRLNADGHIKLNNKLITFLKKLDIDFNFDFDFSEFSIEELIENVKKFYNDKFKIPNIEGRIPKDFTANEDSSVNFHPGAILGFFNIGGSHQRRIMEKMIKTGEIHNLIEVDINKNVYRNSVEKSIFSPKFTGFFKIQPTNFTQDYAHISAILQNTIIWGPPGTGKSQTIANIISNIIALNRTALVSSQKKIALVVLRKRLKMMSFFCLFVINEKLENYKDFYKPIEEYIEIIENFNMESKIDEIEVFSNDDRKYLELLQKIFPKTDIFTNTLEAYKIIETANNFFALNVAEALFKLNKSIKINPKRSPRSETKLKLHIIETQLKRKLKVYEKVIHAFSKDLQNDVNIILTNLGNYDDNLENIFNKISKLEISNFENLEKFLNFCSKPKNEVIDDKALFVFHAKKIFKILDKLNNNTEFQQLYTRFRLSVKQKKKMSPYKFLLKHAEIIKVLFPIIITTPDIELVMFEKKYFDYVVIDEASQMFLEEALPLLFYGKIKILVGDHQQMQPIRWFASKLNEESEDDAFANIESILEYAYSKGVFNIMLDKNYRSHHASLMTFNSRHFYESELKIANNYKFEENDVIEVHNVNGQWDGQQNILEAKAVVEIAQRNINKFPTMIILAFNKNQQNAIEKIIFESYPEIEKLIYTDKIIVNSLENIQGDEADLVIISVAYDQSAKFAATYIARKGGKNALNVATSRARQKMIICKSLNADEIQNASNSEDLEIFKEWINFLDLDIQSQIHYSRKRKNELSLAELNNVKKTKFFTDFQQEFVEEFSVVFPDFETKTNFVVGSEEIDVAVFEQGELLFAIYLDSLEYKEPKEYIKYFDAIKFIEQKNYPVFTLNFVEWKLNRQKIIAKIKEKVLSLKENDLV